MTTSSSHVNRDINLDRHHLHNVRSAFLKLNQARLELARDGLTESQVTFLNVLPMLFHYNHPMLPGYISRNTPSGLYAYHESEEGFRQLRSLARSFQPNRKINQSEDILALYAMGSFGTIAHNKKSDIDFWLCHRPGLTKEALFYLEKKCSSISAWAKKLGLDVTIFIMNNETYHTQKQHNFNHDASGSTQHYLLLDEFYRTAIYLGGQLPAWIFLRPEQEKQYQKCFDLLTQQRLLPDKHLMDFGAIGKVPADEFISSAIWQLYKAIHSPYKSILKLLLLEIYCQNFENPILLSQLFKEQLHTVDHHRVINHWDVDPYLQNYYYIENYLLATNQHPRLEFLRRCFYFKLELSLTHNAKQPKRSDMLLYLTQQWGWNESYIEHLDNHKHWKLKDVLEERRLIINELNYSYQLIIDFFREQKVKLHASNRELNILGRKLHAAFSRKAGKIEWVNPLSSKNISEANLLVRKCDKTLKWIASDSQNIILVKKETPIELIAWLHCNQVMIGATRLHFKELNQKGNVEKAHNMDARLMQSLRRVITSLISLPMTTADHKVFEKPCSINKLLLFVDYRPDQVVPRVSDLSISSLVRLECNIDILSINSWNEIICYNRNGRLLDTLLHIYMQAIQNNHITGKTDILCNHPDRYFQQAIRKYIQPLFESIYLFFKDNPSGRFISYLNGQYLLVHNYDKRSVIKWLNDDDEVRSLLTSPMPYYSPVGFDGKTMSDHPLAIFSRHHRAESVQVFYRRRGEQVDITIIDELGTWYEGEMSYKLGSISLQPLHRFLRAVANRRQNKSYEEMSPFDIFPITFSELAKSSNTWQLEARNVTSQVDSRLGLAIHAVAEYIGDQYQYILYVDEMRFSEIEDGDKAYQQLATIIKKEQNQQLNACPYYISDLDLSPCGVELSYKGELNTSHYLIMKDYLQEKIDRALLSI